MPNDYSLEVLRVPNFLLLAATGGALTALCLLMALLAFLNFRRSPHKNSHFLYSLAAIGGLGFLTCVGGALEYHFHEKPIYPGIHPQSSVYATDPGKLSAWSQRLYDGNLERSNADPNRLQLVRKDGTSEDKCVINYIGSAQPSTSGTYVTAELECGGKEVKTVPEKDRH